MVIVDREAVRGLGERIGGEVLTPTDEGYAAHRRVWNGSISRSPAVIARCSGTDDVVEAIGFGRAAELLTAVRGGGHSFPGLSTCDDGLVIDLSPMRRIEVDAERGTVRAQGGVLLGELDAATEPYGMAVPAGIVTHTGLAGLTLGGGLGWLQRRYGLTVDSLLSVELVTAAGEVLTASADENPELFWGIRGGGGNFGVVTEFEFRMHPVGPEVLAGPIFWPMSDAAAVLRRYRDWVAGSPDELMTIVVQRRAPALAVVPPELVGELVLGIVVCWTGDLEAGRRFVEPMRTFGSPVLDLCQPKPFVAHQAMFDPAFPHHCWYYVRSCDVAELDDEVIDVMVEFGSSIVSPMTSIALWQMGGAMARVSDAETAFGGRGAGFTFNINGNAETAVGFDDEREWARAYWSALESKHQGVYVNFLMEEGEERIRDAYGADRYDRLKALKRTYDPENFFRLNQNVRP